MNKKIIIMVLMFCLVSVMVLGETDKFYKVELNYNQEEISYDSLSVVVSNEDLAESFGSYNAEAIGPNGELLKSVNFDIPLEIFYDQTDPETGQIIGGGTIVLNETEVTLYIPYHENAKEINIYDSEIELKLTIPVEKFSKVSEEEVEEKQIEESEKDEQLIEDKKETEELKQVEKETKKVPVWKWILGIIGLLLIAFIVWIVVVVIKKPR